MQQDFVFSSESVTAGHPDKLCDQISDAIVDRYLRQDPRARVVAECAISTGILFVSIKARSSATVDAPAAARELLSHVGYTADGGFDPRTCTVMTSIHELPNDGFSRIDENLAFSFLGQRVVIAGLGNGQFVPQVARTVLEHEFHFATEKVVVEVG